MQVLVTGGAGYIGSHTILELLTAGHSMVCIDNYANSSPESIRRVESLTGKKVVSYPYDVRDVQRLDAIFESHQIDAVIHFAGYKSVSESVAKPLDYYSNNVGMTIALCTAMAAHGCKKLIFSSSATVYGDPESVPILEDAPLAPTNPYGQSKLICEQILRDVHVSDPAWEVVLLRYFNPVGAHESGMIGEDPRGVPENLLPFIAQVAVGRRDELQVFGGDYPTYDGTCLRDYVHVVDIARGHVSALERGLDYTAREKAVLTVNLGTGRGYSVLDVIKAFEAANSLIIPYEMGARRSGDVASCFAHVEKASKILGWKAALDLERMCRDIWRWQCSNPHGYSTE
nr:UDP-glucose 4-epimerase GalE [uncultured Desulfuromonas sp.]